MGLQTIRELYSKDMKQYQTTTLKFVEEAKRINTQLVEYKKKLDELEKVHYALFAHVRDTVQAAHALDTQGVVQFADTKKLLILAAEHPQPHPIDMGEIDSLADSIESQIQSEMQRKMREHYDKLASSWPSELKPGMTFSKKDGGDIIELIAPPRQLPGKTGDAAIILKVKYIKGWIISAGFESSMTRADLSVQKGWRFLKT